MREMLQLDSLPEYVRQAVELSRGRIMCPKCDGGRSREESLSIRPLDYGIITKLSCWRATCSWYAYVGTAGVTVTSRKVTTANVYRKPTYPLRILSHKLGSDYGLRHVHMTDHGWSEDADGTTLVMPILDAYRRERGHVTRTFDTPKRCYTFKATSQPWLDWWLSNDIHAPVVVVEDALSACRLQGCGLNAVALLGTSMTVDQAKEVADIRGDGPVYLALDRDAFKKAIALRARHQHVLSIYGVVCLTVDIKNIDSDDDIRSLFDGRNESDSSNVRESKIL